MIKIGMIIGERYEILEKIGTGGMSDVYKAKCHKLNRFVAVKVLKQEFSDNANFVSKFHVEAQAAAGLNHPNIVNVFDVGEDSGLHYIVMELVEGITLKRYIEKKARLSVKEAISITIQVCMGIEAAHNNNIIHRDIKPQNIIISKDGKVKVTDFGIAKAVSSNTITSNVMGSVHYTSPEQARGGFSDIKSDIYSLGITLFEMLTGRVAFNGETTVAIAIKHIQDEMPSPREFIAEIPISVEQIVGKCCQKSPDRRYQSMTELIADLKMSLMNPDEDFVKLVDPDEEGMTRSVSTEEVTAIKTRRRVVPIDELGHDDGEDDRHFDDYQDEHHQDEYGDGYYQDDGHDEHDVYHDEYTDDFQHHDYHDPHDGYDDSDDDYDDDDYNYNPRMEKVTTVLAIIAAILIGCVVIFVAAQAFGLFEFGSFFDGRTRVTEDDPAEVIEYVVMIAVDGLQEEEAKRALINLDLIPEIQMEESADVESGVVIRASVRRGERIAVGSNVILTVSIGTEGVTIPDIVNKTVEEAIAELMREGFTYSRIDDYDDFIVAGNVYRQTPAGGSKALSGAMISIWVSRGPEERRVAIPNLIGRTEMDAIVMLLELGLEPGRVSETLHENGELAGLVCLQSYSVGVFVEAGTVVDFSVSLGVPGVLYSYISSIHEPSEDEDADFQAGTLVRVILTTDEEVQLIDTETASFPIPVNFSNITTQYGTVVLRYVNRTSPYTITHDDGTTETVEGQTVSKEIKRRVEFIVQ
ncbi:MAG: Stk1 family PASTA domain-containing Ser/Thr kinase [Lachnospiraceae bacterium]|jgi:serine/threonine-protein kinase|nr:Stk1 family PASTA domain-containing Ser/Thr kinase [Lachnospiraceae bacterium]